MARLRVDKPIIVFLASELIIIVLSRLFLLAFYQYVIVGPGSNSWGEALFFVLFGSWISLLVLTLLFVNFWRQRQRRPFGFAFGLASIGAGLSLAIFPFTLSAPHNFLLAAAIAIYGAVVAAVPSSVPWLRVAVGSGLIVLLAVPAYIYIGLLLFCC